MATATLAFLHTLLQFDFADESHTNFVMVIRGRVEQLQFCYFFFSHQLKYNQHVNMLLLLLLKFFLLVIHSLPSLHLEYKEAASTLLLYLYKLSIVH